MINVIPFVRISCKHLFYENEKMKELQVIPSRETSSLMQKMGIFTRNDFSSMVLAFSEKTAAYFEDNPTKVLLVFNMKNTNSYFQSITNLDAFPSDQKVFYFDNLDKKVNAENVSFLHELDFVSGNDLFLKVNPGFDDSFGVIHLYLDLEMIKPPDEGKMFTWDYEIKFENRGTQWRYYFINSAFQEFPDFNIAHPTEDIEFHPPVLKKLQNGSNAWELASKTKIPLKEQYKDFFTITIKLNKEPKPEVTIQLPNADHTKTRRVMEQEEEQMYSDVYVYI